MMANISPSSANLAETLSTLRFAQRAKSIKNRAKVNEDTLGDMSGLQAEIARLKEELALARNIPHPQVCCCMHKKEQVILHPCLCTHCSDPCNMAVRLTGMLWDTGHQAEQASDGRPDGVNTPEGPPSRPSLPNSPHRQPLHEHGNGLSVHHNLHAISGRSVLKGNNFHA